VKATIEFSLPEERSEFDLHCSAGRMYSALCDIVEHVRRRRKYGEPDESAMAELDALACLLQDCDVYALVDLP
jgi:hypothetical protein